MAVRSFFFNDTATTEIYTLSLHDALPICFMKDENGAVVLSKLESGTLRELAGATHGAYRDASEWVDLPQVLAATVEEGRRGRFVEHNTVRLVERYQWAL